MLVDGSINEKRRILLTQVHISSVANSGSLVAEVGSTVADAGIGLAGVAGSLKDAYEDTAAINDAVPGTLDAVVDAGDGLAGEDNGP
jgi:hypothetical protein